MPDIKNEKWQREALKIGDIIIDAVAQHPQLAPLHTSWMNFARKHHLHGQVDDADTLRTLLEHHGLTIMPKQDVDRFQAIIITQTDEIKALEHRIATLLRP